MQRISRHVGLALLSAAVILSLATGPAGSESIATQVLKGAAIGLAVTKTAEPLDKFINTVTLRHGVAGNAATKVVPILSVGEKGYIGGAQVSGPREMVDRVAAVFQYEKNFSNNNYRAKVLVASASLNPLKIERVQQVGVTAIIDVALDGAARYWTFGTGIRISDALRATAVLAAVKNFGPSINDAVNTITLNSGSPTKVVPMGSFGEKTYLGAAQVSASKTTINTAAAVWVYEGLFSSGMFRVKVVVPTTSTNPLSMKRVDGAGITAIIDMALSPQNDTDSGRKRNQDLLIGVSLSDGRSDGTGDSGRHKGWYKGKHKGRKYEWVDARWREKIARLDDRHQEPFVVWLDRRKDRDSDRFDELFRIFLKETK